MLLDFGRFRTSVCSLIPILPPIVGVATADPVGKGIQLIHQQSGQISGIGRRLIAEGPPYFLDARMPVVGIPMNDSLPVSGPFQKNAPL